MEYTLTHLIDSLQSTLKVLRGGASPQLAAELQGDKLPSKKFEELASRAIDLLHEVEKLLEPSPLVLADHFLGTPWPLVVAATRLIRVYRLREFKMPQCRRQVRRARCPQGRSQNSTPARHGL